MFPGISNTRSLGLGGRERSVPEVSHWNLDLYDNEIYDLYDNEIYNSIRD